MNRARSGRTPRGRRMEPRYVRRRQYGAAIAIASILIIIGTVIYIVGARSGPSGPEDFEGTGDGVVQLVQIEEGSSVSALGPELVDRGIVKSNGAFQAAAGANPAAAKVQPGFYRLQGEMSATSAVDALVDPANKVEMLDIPGGATLMDVRVIGGETRPGIYTKIAAVTCAEGSPNCVTAAELERVAADTDPAELGAPEWAYEQVRARNGDPKRLEGLITPGSYVINPEQDATGILRALVSAGTEEYNRTGIVERARAMDLTPYELLTAASLVEREAPAGDFDKVARVILNRLAEPMRLEFDSTVNYGLTDVEVATTDEDRGRRTPWNTYAMDGLPQTPIAAPSIEAIEAMENPADGNWLFFVTVDTDGTTVFNDTFEDHLRDTQQSLDNGVLDSNR
ncbi:endolytic transglycosylase MltG [Corynebacterium sp. P7003]|uniref:Endolytic murein transglycosylase n=1 Tax=Corynebacterium pygosceleis TaxID=2800406 RepID=A0ABT3WNI4_9CORY|nr:endolytic transglycosylase MltG [Corynebacterium pygosceleis]MCX7443822.1 endolytic transglycosylase MltG [Corynebacterium pygosceleis]